MRVKPLLFLYLNVSIILALTQGRKGGRIEMGGKVCKLPLMLCIVALLFTVCADSSAGETDIADKTYVYERDGFGGDFTIQINDDGTFLYSEGVLSSHMGVGKWTLEENILTLSEDGGYSPVNHFEVDGENLIFISVNSSNFFHVKVANGEKFYESDI